ncbi:MAG TPA: DUF930 domain-containing protein [Pseudolabrys sp.]|nr:DUF930 domain-containing protein [Pseudolabrys sp.]
MKARGVAVAAAFLCALVMTLHAEAAESRFERSLRMLDPTERLAQICDYTAMKKINDARNPFHPDRVVADAISRINITADTLRAAGGAFRSRGKWYELSYTCTASPDHMRVVTFDYRIGAEIPQDKWATYDLWQ